MKIDKDCQGNECVICNENKGTIISTHDNNISHLYHLGCLSLALYQSSTNGNCPACRTPISISPEYQEFIISPKTIFIYSCKYGMTNIVSDILKDHTLHKYIIQTGFACATYGNHIDIIQMLSSKYFLVNESSVNCLSIAIQQKKPRHDQAVVQVMP